MKCKSCSTAMTGSYCTQDDQVGVLWQCISCPQQEFVVDLDQDGDSLPFSEWVACNMKDAGVMTPIVGISACERPDGTREMVIETVDGLTVKFGS
jgi:hypothetical protein